MSVREQFASNLVYLRNRAGLSQEELSFLASLHRTEIGMLERGVRLARVDTLVKLAGALRVTPEELLDGISWQPGELPSGHFEVGEPPAS